jgi:hypothetical protein
VARVLIPLTPNSQPLPTPQQPYRTVLPAFSVASSLSSKAEIKLTNIHYRIQIQNAEYRLEYRIQNTEFRIQKIEYRIWGNTKPQAHKTTYMDL